MDTKELFLEIGSEEIPAGFIPRAMAEMESIMRKELSALRLSFGGMRTMATPRRLILIVRDIPVMQPDAEITATGPSTKTAFDAEGRPTKAAEGFARGHGVDVSELKSVITEKGEYLAVTKREKGRPAAGLLQELLPRLISSIPFRKSMRWGKLDVRFARPVHWIVALFGGDVVPFSFGNVESGSSSRGHRFMADREFTVKDFSGYLEKCVRHFVIPDHEERKKIIRSGTEELAAKAGGVLIPDEELVEQVAFLVEYPICLFGAFPEEFLKVPKEVLITSMKSHQRYFSLADREGGRLLPGFITVSNTAAEDISVVVRGNERVLRARLSDARFFFDEDLKTRMDDRVLMLKRVVYQQKLGTSYEKMERFRTLAEELADALNPALRGKTSRAAWLCKGDLVSGMVGEFPEVQGIMGREYALAEGEAPDVADAIAEHYLPLQAGGELPASDIGAFVSIADKLDTLAGCFAVGLVPTGAADPYALRRAAIGIISIILDKGYRISLSRFISRALDLLGGKLLRGRGEVASELIEFFRARFVNLAGGEFPGDIVDAAVAAGFDDLADLRDRIAALASFREEPEFEPLTVAFKRVGNIIKGGVDAEIDPSLFTDQAETELYRAFSEAKKNFAEMAEKRDWKGMLAEMASLRAPVDNFFDKVMVMAENERIRRNRLALLTGIARMFGMVADFSRIA